MALIQHNINSIAVNAEKVFLGMGNYHLLELEKSTMKCLRKYPLGWEIRTVLADDENVYVGSLGQEFTIISLKKSEKIYVDSHERGVISLCVEKDLVVMGAYNDEVKVLKNRSTIGTLKGHNVRVNTILVTDDYIITGDGFRIPGVAIRFFDKSTLKETKKIELKDVRINALAATNGYLLVGTNSGLYIYDENDKLIHLLKMNADISKIVTIDSNIYFASRMRVYKITIDTFSGKTHSLLNLQSSITSLAADSENIYIGTQDKLTVASHNLQSLNKYTVDAKGNITKAKTS